MMKVRRFFASLACAAVISASFGRPAWAAAALVRPASVFPAAFGAAGQAAAVAPALSIPGAPLPAAPAFAPSAAALAPSPAAAAEAAPAERSAIPAPLAAFSPETESPSRDGGSPDAKLGALFDGAALRAAADGPAPAANDGRPAALPPARLPTGPEKIVLVTLFHNGTPEGLSAEIQGLGRATGFRQDHRFGSELDPKHPQITLIRGAVPEAAIETLSRQAGVLQVVKSVGSVDDLVEKPYHPPLRESAFRAAIRALAERHELLGIAASVPIQLAVIPAFFGPLLVISASGPLAPALWVGALSLVLLTSVGKLLPQDWLLTAPYAALATAGVGLLAQGHPLLGAWVAANGIAGLVAGRKTMKALSAAPNSHPVDKLTNSAELAAHVDAMGWSLMAVSLTFLGPAASFGALALTSLFLAASLLDASRSPSRAGPRP